MKRSTRVAALAVVVAAAAWLRLRGLGQPSFWLDEVLQFEIADSAMRLPWWKWLTPFEAEHGPLFHLTEVAGRFLHSPEASARIAPALFGIAAVVLAPFATRWIDRDASLPFAILIACSPLHVYYSREARPYAMLMLIALLLLSGRTMTASLIAIWTSAVAIPILVAAALGFASTPHRKKAIPPALAAIATLLLYRAGGMSSGPPLRGGTRLGREILESFSVVALDISGTHVIAFVFALFAILGSIDLFRRNRGGAVVTISLAFGTIAITLVALAYGHHWYAIRYLTPALPAYLFLVACGIRWSVSAIPNDAAPAIASLLLIIPGLSAARTEPFRKLPWRDIAATLRYHVIRNDLLMMTNEWSEVCLGFYLRKDPLPVYWFDAHESVAAAQETIEKIPRGWIVSAGFHQNDTIVKWACRYPIFEQDDIENFRLHYVPSAEDFTRTHNGPAPRLQCP